MEDPTSKPFRWSGLSAIVCLAGCETIGISRAISAERDLNSFGQYGPVIQLVRLLAEDGDAEAQNRLGTFFWDGQGVPQDYPQAVAWYRKAADQGNALAQFNLGAAYFSGLGVPHDHKQAVAWYRKSAEQGNISAEANLAGMYEHGWGVDQNLWEAANWYRKAAERGDPTAQFSLGNMFSNGFGVKRDYAEAYVWFDLAASGFSAQDAGMRDLASNYRDQMSKRLSDPELAAAKKLAQDRRSKQPAAASPPGHG